MPDHPYNVYARSRFKHHVTISGKGSQTLATKSERLTEFMKSRNRGSNDLDGDHWAAVSSSHPWPDGCIDVYTNYPEDILELKLMLS